MEKLINTVFFPPRRTLSARVKPRLVNESIKHLTSLTVFTFLPLSIDRLLETYIYIKSRKLNTFIR